jgi:hypothetical protein
MKNLYLLLLFVLAFSILSFSQQSDTKVESGVFTRKSITIVPVSTGNVSNYSQDMIAASYDIPYSPRYDYNTVDQSHLEEMQRLFNGITLDYKNLNSMENCEKLREALVQSGVFQQVIASMGNIDSLNARFQRNQKRIITSASSQMKIEAPTIEQMKTLMNGCFIGIPILESVTPNSDNYIAEGDLIWIRLDVSNVKNWDLTTHLPDYNEIECSIVKTEHGKVVVSPKSDKTSSLSTLFDDEPVNEYTLKIDSRSARQFTRSILKLALTMDEFKLRGTVQDVTDGIRIDLGKREDVYVDQGYKVYELRMDENNNKKSVYTGFMRIDKVGDNVTNEDALSSGYPILGHFEQGFIAKSHDQSFDLVVTPTYRLVSIPASSGLVSSDINSSPGVTVSALYNTSKLTNMTQLFIGVYYGMGFLSASSTTDPYSGTVTTTTVTTQEYGITIVKKFWMNNLNFLIGIESGLHGIEINFSDGNDYQIKGAFGIGGYAGIQIPFSADLLIGLQAGYVYVSTPTEIDLNGTAIPYPGFDGINLDGINLGGLTFGLNVSYSLPAF